MIQKPKGTYDVFDKEANIRQYVNKVLNAISDKYNYGYIETPVFEYSELYHRSVGESTDMVQKETYDFKDRSDRSMTLRPEGTAGVVRWFIENKKYGNMTDPVKVFYNMKMYRYERPGSGRNREFTQWGFENFGSNSYMADIEVIAMAYNAYLLLGLKDITVKLNSLGDAESRENYKKALLDYLKPHQDELCDDCKRRLNVNPLRILDCKIDGDSSILKNAPKTIDYLNKESKEYFDKIKEALDALEINYKVDTSLVRGLDYYNHTVFEIVLKDSYALGGGGRYDSLVETLGGPKVPAVGFAMGYDRTILALEENNIELDIDKSLDTYILGVSDNERKEVLNLANYLRLNGYSTDFDTLNKNLKAQLKSVDRFVTKYLIFLNDEDLKNKDIVVKNNKTKEQEKIKLDKLIEYLDERMEYSE